MLNLRDYFILPDLPDAVELRAFTHGLMPRTVPQMMERFVSDWQRRGVDAWNEVDNHWLPRSGVRVGWWSLPEFLGDHFIARLLGAQAGTCIHQPNVHWSVQCLLSCKELFHRRKKIVVSETEFPSVLFSVQNWAPIRNLEVEIIPSDEDGFLNLKALLAAIDPNTELVFLSHVGFTTGERLPDEVICQIGSKIQSNGGHLVVDGYHAVGSIALDVPALDVDIYLGGLLKEACGSSGNTFVYIRPGLDLTPALGGWFGDADPFAFRRTPVPHDSVRRRFLGGTVSIAATYHAVEGARVLLDAGLKQVEADCREKVRYCIDRADSAAMTIRSPVDEARISTLFILQMERADLMSAWLKSRHVYTDSRQQRYLRMSPFVWNTAAELDRVFDLIEQGLRGGTYFQRPGTLPSGPVT